MAFFLRYGSNDYSLINPSNNESFTDDEVKQLIRCDTISYYHILGYCSRYSRFILAYNKNNVNNISQFNLLATRAYLRGRYTQQEYAILMASMRIDPLRFFEQHQTINFVAGNAIIGTTIELKMYGNRNINQNFKT